ncbi:hypothetical protein DSM104299_01636 [Baekduia alba]|uniref:hypothetical protein n=1 Tax=Baekduia alba TaxID=2997333 RepID=UPI002341917A|nr:hypothetical protein [Baekduia alba]WCB92936.1 hypothetical protein DSM104299_01636 [Baekduia alba]
MSRLATPLSALAVAGASLALVACGSSDSSSSSTTGDGSASAGQQGGTRDADFQKFQQCLKDNGVTLPDRRNGQGGLPSASSATPPTTTDGTPPQGGFPGGGGGAPGGAANNPKFQKAMQACAKYRPQGAGPGAGPGGGRGGYGGGGNGTRPRMDIKAYTPYLTCLEDRGLDVRVADGFNALRNLKQTDPQVQAAFKACQSKLPQRPRAGGTTTTGTT